MYVAADVSREDEVARLVQTAVETCGKLDVLVNNAGVAVYKPLQELTEEDFDLVVSVNQKGTFFATKHAVPAMIAAGGPRRAEVMERCARETPLGNRIGTPEDCAPLYVYLASDESGFVTGQKLAVDGGILAESHII